MIKEVCVETFEEAKLAEKQGANRIELCSDLANDGLTPSSNLMSRIISELKIPIMTMVRPRAGNFVHTKKEVEQMKKDIDAAKQAGAAGVVFGLLTSDNKISKCTLTYMYNGKEITAQGEGNGPIDACKSALMKNYAHEFSINSYSEHSCGENEEA